MTQAEAFGALCAALEWDTEHLTPSARSLVGKVAKELVAAGATEEAILYSPTAWHRMWGQGELPTLTITAIATHWPALWKEHTRHLRALESAEKARERERKQKPIDVTDFLFPEARAENARRYRAMLERLELRSP